MKRTCILLALLSATLAAPARAQPAPPGNVASEEPVTHYLERRVPEELATEGTVLSRQGLALRIEPAADKWLVSIVDAATGRVAAATTVPVVASDRESAVATVTHVAADLVTQIAGRAASVPKTVPVPVLIDDRAERQQREAAELEFRRRAIRFGDAYSLYGNNNHVSIVRRWVAYQGELNQRLEPEQFYGELGRPDLYRAYLHRQNVGLGWYVAGSIALVGSIVAISAGSSGSDGVYVVSALAGGGCLALFVGSWYRLHPHPVSENEAKNMADAYNQQLRRQLGLATGIPSPRTSALRVRDWKLAPYAASNGGGLVLGARF
jgi:hypothetical protein